MSDSTLAPVPVSPSRTDRLLAAVDRLRHPFLTHELSVATHGFRAHSVVRRYDNDSEGRRLETREGPILWHRGYRPPSLLTHNAIWNTGGPVVTVGYNRELLPAVIGERGRAFEERMGLRR